MTHTYWNDWYFGWGWFLWFGIKINREEFGQMRADIPRR
jgi:hypothetical protein